MNRLLKTISMLEYFINRSWEWSTNNTEMLLSELSPEDQRVSMADSRAQWELGIMWPDDGGVLGIQTEDSPPPRKQIIMSAVTGNKFSAAKRTSLWIVIGRSLLLV